MGKASEFDERTTSEPLTQQEVEARRYGVPTPELRFTEEAQSRSLDGGSAINDGLAELANSGIVPIRGDAVEPVAVMISAKRYLELVKADIQENQRFSGMPDGSVRPTTETLAQNGVEQTDPTATWRYVGRNVG